MPNVKINWEEIEEGIYRGYYDKVDPQILLTLAGIAYNGKDNEYTLIFKKDYQRYKSMKLKRYHALLKPKYILKHQNELSWMD